MKSHQTSLPPSCTARITGGLAERTHPFPHLKVMAAPGSSREKIAQSVDKAAKDLAATLEETQLAKDTFLKSNPSPDLDTKLKSYEVGLEQLRIEAHRLKSLRCTDPDMFRKKNDEYDRADENYYNYSCMHLEDL